MTVFRYTAFTADGRRVSGTRRSRTLGEARRAIGAEGLHGIRLTERERVWNRAITAERIGRAARQRLLRQLAVFVNGGIPVVDALQVLADESEDRLTRAALLAVIDDVRAGSSLAAALGARPELLAPHHTGVIRAAEATGRLGVALADVEKDLAREVEVRTALRAALTYPLVVITLAAITVIVLTSVVMPKFERLFDDADATPPLATRILLSASRVPTTVPAGGLFAVIVALIVVAVVSRQQRVASTRDRLVLHLPVLGGLVRLAALERFCRVLGASVRSGVPLPAGVRSAGDAMGNEMLRRRVHTAHDRILAGQGLSRSLADLEVLTPAVRQMIAVGEATGVLADQCELAGDHVHSELRRRVTRATAVIEPALILAVGLVVGFVAVALISSMYGLIGDLGPDVT